ncbi:MAG: hypothetical protein HYT71_00445 [Candidatus Aenigmarchaeota archaeon]|nr:hypothetical protein [Candidatus Aenigmarchaeota archaeon]
MNFCPRCGKEDKLIDGLCLNCFKETTVLAEFTGKLVQCSICKRWLSKGTWKTFEEALQDGIKHKGLLIETDTTNHGNYYTIEYSIDYKKNIFKGVIEVHSSVRKIACTNCSRTRGGYYEAMVQLRGNWRKPFEYANWVGTSKVDERKEGVDLYVIKFAEAGKLVGMLKKKFKPEVKESSSMAGMKDGQHINRKTIMLRFK